MSGSAATNLPGAPIWPSLAGRLVASPGSARLALFWALFALALTPVATTPIPAMVDYVNHLARMYLLAADGTPQASPFYHADWQLYPNLAMDLAVPKLARWTGVEAATRLFLALSQILVVTGSMAIERQIKGGFAISGFVAVLYLFNVPFAWGFLNFEFALGVALWGIAAWLGCSGRPQPLRFAVHTLAVVVLFAGHLFALGLYGVTLGIHEAWLARRAPQPVIRLGGVALQLGAPVAALLVIMRLTGGSVGGSTNEWFFAFKPVWPFLLLNGDSALVAVLGTLLLAGLLHWLWKRGDVSFVQSGAWLATGFGVLYVVIPSRFLDTAFVDVRVLVGAVLILPAFMSITFAEVRHERLAAGIVAVVALANVAAVARVWSGAQADYRQMIASFDKIEPRAKLLVAHDGVIDDPPLTHLADYPLYHAPTLAAHYRDAFIPTLFATPGKQPLTIAPEMRRLSFSDGGPVEIAWMKAVASRRDGNAEPTFLRSWWRDFDYVYVLGGCGDNPLPQLLKLVERQQSFALYRIRHENDDVGKPAISARGRP